MAGQNPFHFRSSLPPRQLHTLLDNFRVTASVNEILTEDAFGVLCFRHDLTSYAESIAP